MKSLKKGDWIVYYTPREGMGRGEQLQAFTTIGQVTSEAPYQAEQAMTFLPYRVDVSYLAHAEVAPIRALLSALEFTSGRESNWGILLRGPKREITERDMRQIATAMRVLKDFEKLQR